MRKQGGREMKPNDIVKPKESFYPLYNKKDFFKVIKINTEEGRMPIEAMKLKDKKIYGFDEGELEEK